MAAINLTPGHKYIPCTEKKSLSMQHPEGWVGAAAGLAEGQAGALGKEVPGILEDGYTGAPCVISSAPSPQLSFWPHRCFLN